MTDEGSRGRVKLGELIDAALAPADPAAHAGFVVDLALITRTDDTIAAVADRFLSEGDPGRRVFLEWLARVRARAPEPVLAMVPKLLTDGTLSDELRVRAAARALRASRSPKEYLAKLVPPLTAGLSPLDAVARLRAVQVRLRRSKVLDALIARREQRLRLTCPRCRTRLGLAAMARHLYEAHGLVLDRGRARRPESLAKYLRKRYAAARDTTLLDEAASLSDSVALRTWAARTHPTPADLAPLLELAAGSGNGLCPRCLAELRPSVEPLPPPLTLAGGRLSGDGYTVEVRGPDGLRTCTIDTPIGLVRTGLDGRRAIGPRATGVLAAVAVLAVAVAFQTPMSWAGLIAIVIYATAWWLRDPLPAARARAIDRAWSDLVPRLPGGAAAERFLARLCRASLGHGDPDERVTSANRVAGNTTDPAGRATARFLLADDSARRGVDRVAALGGLITDGLCGEHGPGFAEHITELFFTHEPKPPATEAARLRVLALDGVFEAGVTPRGLADLWAACPRLHELMGVQPLSRLGVQYAAWTVCDDPPWKEIAGTGSVFELARVAPSLAGRLLLQYPDLLLYYRPPPLVDEALGWVLVCAGGVVVGGKLVADADAEIKVDGGRLIGSATLSYGPHRLTLARRPPAEFVTTLRRLMRIRADRLLPRLDDALAPGPTHPSLAELVCRCGCGAEVFVSPGRVGRVAHFRKP